MNAVAREARTSGSGPLGQLATYAAIGLVSTAAYALLFWCLRPLAPAAVANAVALLVTAIANTGLYQRLGFHASILNGSSCARHYSRLTIVPFL